MDAIVCTARPGGAWRAHDRGWHCFGVAQRPQKEHDAEAYPNQSLPVRLAPLVGVKISFVAAGAAAVHSVAIATDGRLFAWGRNEAAQLGLGDLMDRNAPTEVALPGGAKVRRTHAREGN